MRPRPIAPPTRSFQCPACGYPLEIRAPGQTKTIACKACSSILDGDDPQNKIIAKYTEKARPLAIPLGRRGTLDGVEWECLGAQLRHVADNSAYQWWEHLLWNPYHGYRWLVLSDGHWALLGTCLGIPTDVPRTRHTTARFDQRDYRVYQSSKAKTVYVLGEFPWEVRRGDLADTADYVAPPYQLSREQTGDEVVWSVGRYLEPDEVRDAFGLDRDTSPLGIGPAQPSPWEGQWPAMNRLVRFFLLAALVIQITACVLARKDKVFEQTFHWNQGEPMVQISEDFEIEGRRANVRIRTVATVDNHWAYFNYTLVNMDTGQALDVGREVSYYHGSSGGESWKEGSPRDKVFLTGIDPGRYFLRIEHETDTNPLSFTVEIEHDVPRLVFFIWSLVLIGCPYLFFAIARTSFEQRRWQNSDYGP